MNVRLGAGLADHQRRPFEKKLAARGRQFFERDRAAKSRLVVLAHDPELGAGLEHEFGGAVFAGHQVTSIAEKHEAAVDEPSQEVADLDQFAAGRGLLANLQCAAGHLIEIAGGLVDLGQNRDYVALDLACLLGRGDELQFRVNERLAALGRQGPFEGCDPPVLVASDFDNRVKNRANARAKMMEIFEQAVDDERGIGGHGLDHGERVVIVAGDGLDPRDDGLGANRKEFERRLDQSQPPLGRDALAIVGGVACKEPLSKRGHERSRVRGKVPVD